MTEPSLLDLDQGFLALPRRLWNSPWFRSLQPEEKVVVLEMLMSARYAEGGEFYYAGQRIPIAVGEFIDSDESIAQRLGVSRKTVRRTREKANGRLSLGRRKVHPAGQCPHVTKIGDYERIRYAGGEPGQRKGPPTGDARANGRANERAPSEQGEPREPREPWKPREPEETLTETSARSPETATARNLRERVEREIGYSVKPAAPEGAAFLDAEIETLGFESVAESCIQAGRRSPHPVVSMNYFAAPGVLEGADRGLTHEPGPLMAEAKDRLRRRRLGLPVEAPQQGPGNEGETNSSVTEPPTGTDKA